MLKLEQQVVHLDLSKRLKELGVKQESLFRWKKYSLKDEAVLFFDPENHLATLSGRIEYELSAFTVAELGDMLPRNLTYNNQIFSLNCGRTFSGFWMISYETIADSWRSVLLSEMAQTEADARAKIIIQMIEEKLIKV